MASGILPTLLALLLATSLRPAHALQVTPGSPCAALCIDDPDLDPFSASSSSTNASDIVCQDSLYTNSDRGEKFKSCLDCLQKSDKTNGTEADNYWLLYNLRHALGTCLYGFGDEDKVINSPCVIKSACEPLEDAILAGDLDAADAAGDDALGYCSAGNGSLFGGTLRSCIDCLKSSSDETYLGNFMVALQVGCRQEPEPGETLGISGTPFTRSNLKVTTGSSDDDEEGDPGASPSSLTTGAIVGIAVGVALFVFGGVALCFIYRRKKRKNDGAPPESWRPGGAGAGGSGGGGGGGVSGAWKEGGGERSGTPGMSWGGAREVGEGGTVAGRRVIGRADGNGAYGRAAPGGTHDRGDSLSSIPAHPAYIPNANTSRANTPTPPLSQRRNPFENSSVSSMSSSPSPPPAGRVSPPRQPPTPLELVVTAPPKERQPPADFVLPPPPARKARVPSVSMPAPGLKAPKKYTPPSIVIDAPVETRSPRFVRVEA